MHVANNVSLPPLGGCPTPLRGRWWCCFHWPLQPMLGTWWWQRYKNRGMDLLLGWGFSKSRWSMNAPWTPLSIIQKKRVYTMTKWKRWKDASSRHLPGGHTTQGIAYGNPVIVPLKRRKIDWETPPAMQWLDADEDCCKGCNVRKWQRRQSAPLPADSTHGSQWSCEVGQRGQQQHVWADTPTPQCK